MAKSRGSKSRARRARRRQGAGFAAANAGTLHVHDSGSSSTDLRPTDPRRWGAESAPDMRAAAALIGACIEECAPCRRSLSAKLLDADPIVLAVTAGAVFGLHASRGADAGDFAAMPCEVFLPRRACPRGRGQLPKAVGGRRADAAGRPGTAPR